MAQQLETPFRADHADELPVGLQLAWRLRALIASRRLAPGERLPSVRTLAEWAGVNVNTVRGVYARLEDEGMIVTRHGSGSFVAETAAGSTEVERIAAEAMAAARESEVDPRDVAIVALVSAALPEALADGLPSDESQAPTGAPAPPANAEEIAAELELDDAWLELDDAAGRRELRRQIARLEAELAHYPRELAEVGLPAAPRRGAEPRIADVSELEHTRDALLSRLAAARAAAIRRARRERRARQVRDAIVADPAGHRWEVVSAAETGEEGCLEWEASPRLGPLGALMSWWRVKVSGGCPLAAPREAVRHGMGQW